MQQPTEILGGGKAPKHMCSVDVRQRVLRVYAGKVAVAKNGSWDAEGCGVMLEGEVFKVAVYPAISAGGGSEVRYCFAAPFKHGPPEPKVWG